MPGTEKGFVLFLRLTPLLSIHTVPVLPISYCVTSTVCQAVAQSAAHDGIDPNLPTGTAVDRDTKLLQQSWRLARSSTTTAPSFHLWSLMDQTGDDDL